MATPPNKWPDTPPILPLLIFHGKTPGAAFSRNPRFDGQNPPEAAVAADETSVVSAAKKAATSQSHPPHPGGGAEGAHQGVVDFIEMSDVAADVAALLAADTTDVLSAAKAASGGSCSAKVRPRCVKVRTAFNSKATVQ